MSEQGIFPVSEVRHFRRLLAAFVSAEPKLNIHHNNGRNFFGEIQGYEAVNLVVAERAMPVVQSGAGTIWFHGLHLGRCPCAIHRLAERMARAPRWPRQYATSLAGVVGRT